MTKPYTAAKWSTQDDDFTQMFYDQNVKQFWLPEEIAVANDLLVWKSLKPEEKQVYKKVLAGLTLLDTEQGNTGVPKITEKIEGHQRKAVLNFMAMMENTVHAKSYSNIFISLASAEEINEVFQWVEDNPLLQKKAEIVNKYYQNIGEDDVSLYLAMATSVLLESFLFYSGFYYPLYLASQGKMTNSGEIINLIIRKILRLPEVILVEKFL